MYRATLMLFLLLAGFASVGSADDWGALTLLGRTVEPGTKVKFPFIPNRSFEASYLNTPVFVARGAEPGPTLCITAGVHGDELNGVEVSRRAFSRLDPATLRGWVEEAGFTAEIVEELAAGTGEAAGEGSPLPRPGVYLIRARASAPTQTQPSAAGGRLEENEA